VYLEAGADAKTAWVTVSDTGTGISPADLPRVFDRFYRGDQSRSRDSGGFGLGLSIAAELVEAMGGSLTVSSRPGAGSCFRVALRRAE
jgi:two-component system sensor histidine kinase BaeS